MLVLALVVIVGAYAYTHKGSLNVHLPGPQASPGAAGGTAFVFATGTGGESLIYSAIDSARSGIDMTMYELSDTTAVNDLIAREKAGVHVRVILDQAERKTNQSAASALTAGGVGVVWSSTAFQFTHQKTLTIDDRKSLILTGNLTSTYYAETRDFGDVDTDSGDVQAIVAVFDADYAHKAITPSDATDLLWSPTTAQSRLLSVIEGAHRSLDVEAEEFNDPAVVDALAAKAKAGVAVRIAVESPSQYASDISKVVRAGGKVVGYSSAHGLYIHAKMVIADYGASGQAAEIGSMNFTANSLGHNRELGIILRDSADCTLLERQFAADFAGGAQES